MFRRIGHVLVGIALALALGFAPVVAGMCTVRWLEHAYGQTVTYPVAVVVFLLVLALELGMLIAWMEDDR